MPYEATWSSLRNHPAPQWLRDGKFGVYTHWGVYSVPACGPNVTWYPYNMYREGTAQHRFHVECYGGPERFGYKDFIPMFTGEKFDAEEWADLFHQAGAAFAGLVAEHHDGFAMWPTACSPWNAAQMGPKRDVVGLLEKAVRARGMKFMAAFHHAENWKFYPHWRKRYDTSDPRFEGLYGRPHNPKLSETMDDPTVFRHDWEWQDRPDKEFLDRWLGKIQEVVERYSPDMLWFDFGLGFVEEHCKLEMASMFYNAAESLGKQAALVYKWHQMVPGSGVEDVEQGGADRLLYHDWLTDTTVDDGEAWGYQEGARYKSSDSLIRALVDNVSKNGALLLNIGPRPDGSIPDEARSILLAIGGWLSVNGEAIYGTTPWMTYGEGPTREEAGAFKENVNLKYTPRDIRFTCKKDALYAIFLGWPDGEALIESCAGLYPGEIRSVSLLGDSKPLDWRLTKQGLAVRFPERRPCAAAYALKINRERPF